MRKFTSVFRSTSLARNARAYFVAAASAGVLLASPALVAPVQAHPGDNHERNDDRADAQIAALDQLLADFHGALSYGGNITAMMSLWAQDSFLIFNGTPYIGNAAVQSFFTTGGYFHNNWVSLAPEYKTQITLHGNIAECSTQCVAIDLNATPNVVKAVIQVNAVALHHGGKWIFISMNNTSPAPL